MGYPLRIERIGVDAALAPPSAGFGSDPNYHEWTWSDGNGLRVGVSREVTFWKEGELCSWRVSLGWRDIVLRGETSDDLDDAFDAAMEHAHAYVPKLWSVVYDLVEAEKARRQNELARLDREAEAADEEAQ